MDILDVESFSNGLIFIDTNIFLYAFNKKADFIKGLEEDLIFAKRTGEAFKRYQNGKFLEMDFDEFMEEASKW